MATAREIADRLGMHPTSIQKAGFGMDEQLSKSTLIQFLSTRRKAAGAWRADKAALANAWYEELTGDNPTESNPVEIPQISEPKKASNQRKKRIQKSPKTIKESVDSNRGFDSFIKSFSILDIVFYTNMLVAWYGLILILHEMGFAFGIVYTLVSIDAMKMAKNRYARNTARSGITAIWILEFFTVFIHIAMFNKRAWQAAYRGDLPMDQQWFPFVLACILGTMFSGFAIYAVTTTLDLTSEGVEAENFENRYGEKYG
jgi:hypothetical protein